MSEIRGCDEAGMGVSLGEGLVRVARSGQDNWHCESRQIMPQKINSR